MRAGVEGREGERCAPEEKCVLLSHNPGGLGEVVVDFGDLLLSLRQRGLGVCSSEQTLELLLGLRNGHSERAPAVWKPLGLCKDPDVGFSLGVSKITIICSILLLTGVRSTLYILSPPSSLTKVTILLSTAALWSAGAEAGVHCIKESVGGEEVATTKALMGRRETEQS